MIFCSFNHSNSNPFLEFHLKLSKNLFQIKRHNYIQTFFMHILANDVFILKLLHCSLVCIALVVWFLVNITLSALGARPICHIRQLTVNCDCFKSGAVGRHVCTTWTRSDTSNVDYSENVIKSQVICYITIRLDSPKLPR